MKLILPAILLSATVSAISADHLERRSTFLAPSMDDDNALFLREVGDEFEDDFQFVARDNEDLDDEFLIARSLAFEEGYYAGLAKRDLQRRTHFTTNLGQTGPNGRPAVSGQTGLRPLMLAGQDPEGRRKKEHIHETYRTLEGKRGPARDQYGNPVGGGQHDNPVGGGQHGNPVGGGQYGNPVSRDQYGNPVGR